MAHLLPLGRSEATPRYPAAAEADQPTLRHSRTAKSTPGIPPGTSPRQRSVSAQDRVLEDSDELSRRLCGHRDELADVDIPVVASPLGATTARCPSVWRPERRGAPPRTVSGLDH